MEFGTKKCGVVVLMRGKLCKNKGIQLMNGHIKEVDDEDYKYLCILELDKSKEREIWTYSELMTLLLGGSNFS